MRFSDILCLGDVYNHQKESWFGPIVRMIKLSYDTKISINTDGVGGR